VAEERLYGDRANQRRERRKFEAEYGARGDYVYGATVGKVKREQDEERRRNEADHREAEARADRMGTYEHAESHSEPSHHIGPCDESCRAGRRAHSHRLSRMNVPRTSGSTLPSRGTNR
jgi:hypothetical protein